MNPRVPALLLASFVFAACSSSTTPVGPTDSGTVDASHATDVSRATDAPATVDSIVSTDVAMATDVSTASDTGADDAGTVWLCRPGLASNPCESPLDTTIVQADGGTSVETATADPNAPIDCFYVYPTVSGQTTVNADLTIDPAETDVAIAQASRFSQVCKVYAPMYRQITLSGLFSAALDPAAELIAYGDVLAAWDDYAAHDNGGRPVVLIGHSQGASVLKQLIKDRFDNVPATRALLVSAMLMGGNVLVPTGMEVGGDFAHIPACTSPSQNGCVVAYSTFSTMPPIGAYFGIAAAGTGQVLCTNPAALMGGTADLHPYFPAHTVSVVLGLTGTTATIPTPWVSYPMLWSGDCTVASGASWLQIDDIRGPGDLRPVADEILGPLWGLHLLDVNIALGDLVGLVRTQAAAH